jgi:hypothetical protein
MIQTRVDGQSFIYMSNFAKGMKRSGEIWLSMAKELYVEDKRKMKTLTPTRQSGMVELMKPTIDENGKLVIENDLSSATFDVVSDVGPSSSSKKQATVRALTGMIQLTQDPETANVLTAMAMMNMEGEGLSDTNAYFRKKLLRMGVVKPTEEEAQELMAEMQGQPQDPNAIYLQAAAEEAEAKAAQARASTVKTIADAELSQAKTTEVLAGIGQEPTNLSQRKMELEATKLERELQMAEEKHALEMMLSGAKIEKDENGRTKARSEIEVRSEEVSKQLSEAINSLKDVVTQQAESTKTAAEATANAQLSQAAAQEKVAETLKKPRRIVREKGKIVGIKLED